MPRTIVGTLPSIAALRADLFSFTLQDGVTVYHWTSWDSDLVVSGVTYTSFKPWPKRTKWNLTNTMAVPSMEVEILASNDAFAGGASIKQQIHNGLFDGAAFKLTRAFYSAPGTLAATIDLFSGLVAGIAIEGGKATVTVKGKNNLLDQYAPRNVYQIQCNHAFCDAGCTLTRATYTASYTVGSSPAPSSLFIPWVSAPSNPGRYLSGTVTMTSGGATGQKRTIGAADSTGLTLTYPFYSAPSAGDTFTAFEGCDKTYNGSGSVQSCTTRSNTANYDGFPFVPPPSAAF